MCASPAAIERIAGRPDTAVGTTLSSYVPRPNCPLQLAPQVRTVPLTAKATEEDPPAANCAICVCVVAIDGLVRPLLFVAACCEANTTGAANHRSAKVPSPSCPLQFAPHAQMLPSERSAREWAAPAAIATTWVNCS